MNKVFIVGDHSRTHSGCRAVIGYINKILKDGGYELTRNFDEASHILVNGEGSMHHNSKNYIDKMNFIKKSQEANKKTYLINSVWQSNDSNFDNVLKALDGFVVREESSYREVKKNHSISPQVRIDLSYFFDLHSDDTGYKNLKKQIAVTDFYSKDFGGWVKYSGGRHAKMPYIDLNNFSWAGVVKTLQSSSFLITGRHHAVFAACRAKTPFVALESNTHKISGFVRMSKIPIPICSSPREINKSLQWAKNNPNAYNDFFDFLDLQPKFKLSDIGL